MTVRIDVSVYPREKSRKSFSKNGIRSLSDNTLIRVTTTRAYVQQFKLLY